jgi:cellulose synthase/poly-beta-1,6-N-acetylglucosamine synthase-like glycosyltransferase
MYKYNTFRTEKTHISQNLYMHAAQFTLYTYYISTFCFLSLGRYTQDEVKLFLILMMIYLDYVHIFISFVTRKLPLRVKRTL